MILSWRDRSSNFDHRLLRMTDPTEALLKETEKLDAATESLNRAKKIAAETEDLGVRTLSGLEANREIIERTHSYLPDVNRNVRRGERIAGSIRRKLLTNRIICLFTLFIYLTMFGLIIYLAYFDDSLHPSHH